MAISIYKAGPSMGAVNLKNELRATLLKSQGSRYTPRPNKLLINWGSSGSEAQRLFALTAPDNFLNTPSAVGVAANKLRCLEVLAQSNVRTVPWYTRLEDALAHAGVGRIYARTQLTGHSGEGIRLIMGEDDPQVTEVPTVPFPVDFIGDIPHVEYLGTRLFTVGITGKRQEWRIHVIKGQVVLKQLKLRRQGFEDSEGYTSLVRNVETGWIYSVNFDAAEYPQLQDLCSLAVEAIEALGLDFGAVDIVEKRGQGYVLEVNTAPGLGDEGSALQAYSRAFRSIEQAL